MLLGKITKMTSRLSLKGKKSRPPNDDIDKSTSTRSENMIIKQNRKIFKNGIASARKHRINLECGRGNHGGGNCSYESVIFNINDRKCFQNKFHMSLQHYRIVWNKDLMNKILDQRTPWNPGLSRKDIIQGFQELMVSGVYEREFFGDMMMAGIACGVRKIILIFHTNEDISNTGHDPIAVIDPRDYGGLIDSEIPVVVAYNLVHYESLHPISEDDIKETVKFV